MRSNQPPDPNSDSYWKQILRRLSQPQLRVMHFLGRGRPVVVGPGTAVKVDGRQVCRLETLESLERALLSRKDPKAGWVATAFGMQLVKVMGV